MVGRYRVTVARIKTCLVEVEAKDEQQAAGKAMQKVKEDPERLKYTREWRAENVRSTTESDQE